jgi:L-ascorbate metabolism protein UlaG (beta-lactamase superfamily)
MRFLCLPLALALAATAALAADEKPDEKKDDPDKGKLVIRWHGQSFFEITAPNGTRIVIDPHGLEQYRMNLKEEAIDADVILISHPHSDHSHVKVVKGYKDPKKVRQLWGVDEKTKDWNAIKEEIKGVKIQTVGTFHDKVSGMEKGKNSAFILEMDGLRVVHLGDLGHVLTPKQVDRIGPVDVLMVPIGGVYTLHGLDAQKVVDQLNPKRNIIPMHYGTIVYDWLLDLKKSHFLDDVPRERVEELKTNKLVIDPKSPPPKEAKFTILHFFEDRKSD